MLPSFRLNCYRLHLRAKEPVLLPPFSGSSLRGAFAAAFRQVTCQQPQRRECPGCMLQGVCAYPSVFEPRPPQGARNATGFEHFPRPFVVVPPRMDEREFPAGALLQAGLTLFGRGNDSLPYFLVALSQLAHAGIGRGRGAMAVERVEALHPLTGESTAVWDGPNTPVRSAGLAVDWAQLTAHASGLPVDRLTIRFVTPTCLLVNRSMAHEPDFATLLRCLLRRLTRIAQGYCEAQPQIDYGSLLERAAGVRVEHADLQAHAWERYSRRQDRRLPAHGILGRITYAGPLAEFLPLVLLGTLVHVGDNAALGQGRYEIVE